MTKIFVYISILSALVPLITGASAWRFTGLNRPLRFIYFLVIWSFSADVVSYIVARIYASNYWVINLYFIGELVLITVFFYAILPQQKIILLVGLVLLSLLVYPMMSFGMNQRPDLYLSFNQLVIIFLSLWFYYTIFVDGKEIFIENSPLFWINTGILVYFAGGLFSTLLAKEILSDPSISWIYHNIANILKNILFAIGLWKVKTA